MTFPLTLVAKQPSSGWHSNQDLVDSSGRNADQVQGLRYRHLLSIGPRANLDGRAGWYGAYGRRDRWVTGKFSLAGSDLDTDCQQRVEPQEVTERRAKARVRVEA
jgi:hypothetical protein